MVSNPPSDHLGNIGTVRVVRLVADSLPPPTLGTRWYPNKLCWLNSKSHPSLRHDTPTNWILLELATAGK